MNTFFYMNSVFFLTQLGIIKLITQRYISNEISYY